MRTKHFGAVALLAGAAIAIAGSDALGRGYVGGRGPGIGMFLIPCYGLAGVIGWFVAQKGDFWKGPLNVLVSLLAFAFLLWLIFGGLAWTAQTERTLLALGIGVTVCGGSGWLLGRWLKRS